MLLILAGITINAIAGEDGILTKATQAKDSWKSAVGDEEQDLENLNQWIDSKLPKDWDAILEDANNNPEKYIHQEQSETNGDIGIGTDGKPVNLDLWNYSIGDTSDYIRLGENFDYGYIPAYSDDDIVDGKIQGKVPVFIKVAEMEEFLPVTDLRGAFYGLENLVEAPVLPMTVVNLLETFKGCENLKIVPNIDANVQEMYHTFSYCSNLENAPKVPDSVTNMYGCYYKCLSLKNVPKLPSNLENMNTIFSYCESLEIAPNIPEKVGYMSESFLGCTNLKTVTKIPESVEVLPKAFSGCTNLTGIIEINATPDWYVDCFKNASTAEGANLVILNSSKSTNLDEIIATKSSNSNITRER